MADSDNDDGDSITNEVEVFQEEIKSTITSSLSDTTAFRSLIAEVEHLRNAYKQDPSSLNKAVLNALFELPFSTSSQSMALTVYFERMGKLFEQYHPLIKSLKRDKKTQQEGGIAVADPLIHLLTTGKLSLDEWSQGQAKTGLGTLLTQHGVIAESQIAIAINTIEEVCHPVAMPEDVAGPSAAAMGGAASQVTSGKCTKKLQGLKRKRVENLSTPQFSGTFTWTGGNLHWWMSDDYLEIPEGAIPKGETWTIRGNIHTSLDNFAHFLKKPKGECFVAAINDYRVEGGYTFKKPVKVVVHHSVYNPFELASLCIQLYDDERGLIDVPYHTKKIAGGPWYEVEGPTILVYTYHFTKIMCKICDSQECSVKAIKSLVYGKITADPPNKFFATIEVYIHFIRNVERLPVFGEMFNQEQERVGWKLLKAKEFPPSLRLIAPEDKISVKLNCTDKAWKFLEDSDFQNMEIPAGDHIPCLAEAYDPVCLGTYLLQGSAPTLNGNITLSVGNSKAVKLPVTMTADIVTTVDERQVARPPAEWILRDATLFDIAKKLKSKTWYEFGLKLGLTGIELDHIEENNSNQTVERKIFKMLCEWRDRQPRTGEQESESKNFLCRIMRETTNRDALELLGQTIPADEELAASAGVTDSASSSSQASDDQALDKHDNG